MINGTSKLYIVTKILIEGVITMSIIHVRYIIACERTIEHSVNNVDFIGVFEAKSIPEVPTKCDFSIVICFEYLTNKNTAPEVTIRLINPEGNIMAKELEIKLDEQKDMHERERIISVITVQLPNFPVNEEGFYRFQVLDGTNMISEQVVLFELGVIK